LELIKCKQYNKENKINIITNGGNNGEEFVREVREILKCNGSVLVFCCDEEHSKWTKKFDDVKITYSSDGLLEWINEKNK